MGESWEEGCILFLDVNKCEVYNFFTEERVRTPDCPALSPLTEIDLLRVMWRTCFAILVSLCLAGCSPAGGGPEEPRGESVPLLVKDIVTSLPPSMCESITWHRRGDGFAIYGETEKALFCYRQAQATFPKEPPEFPAGTHWSQREWSGHPVATYHAKVLLYSKMGHPELARHYLELARKNQEHPSDKNVRDLAEALVLYREGRFAEAAQMLKGEDHMYGRLIHFASRVKAGDQSAELELFYCWKQILSLPNSSHRFAVALYPEDLWKLGETNYLKKKAEFQAARAPGA